MKTQRLLLIALTLLLGACAIGNTYDYQSHPPTLDVTSEGDVVVAVQDQRPYVVSSDKEPQFVGLQRGGFGNPFDVRTSSGDPLANDFADAIVQALARQGIDAQSVPLDPGFDKQEAIDAVLARGGSKSLLIYMRQWKSDTYTNVALIYDLEAEVLGPGGVSLATNDVVGREDLGGDFINPPSHAAQAVPKAFGRVLERLLGSRNISNALR